LKEKQILEEKSKEDAEDLDDVVDAKEASNPVLEVWEEEGSLREE
jgi:hypothetical protein